MTDSILAFLLTYWVHSSLLLCGAWLLDRIATSSARSRDRLWKTALLGGIVTATLQAASGGAVATRQWSLSSGTPAVSQPIAAAQSTGESHLPLSTSDLVGDRLGASGDAAGAVRSSRDRVGASETSNTPSTPLVGAPDLVAASEAPPAAIGTAAAPPQALGESSLLERGSVLPKALPPLPHPVWIWMLIAGALCLRVLSAQLGLNRTLEPERTRAPSRLVAMTQQLAQRGELRRPVRVSLSPNVATPVALGLSEVVLPERVLEELSLEEIEAALAHEVAHLRRGDPAWRLVAAFVGAVFFFQPLNFLARRRLGAYAEVLADDWAVHATGSPIPLARCLTNVAAWIVQPSRVSLAAIVPMATHRASLSARIERVLSASTPVEVRPSFLRSSAGVGVLVLLGMWGPGVVASAPPADEAPGQRTAGKAGEAPATPAEGLTTPRPSEAIGPRTPTAEPSTGTPVPSSAAQEAIHRHPDPSEPLAARVAWATRQITATRMGEVWLAFTVPTLVPEGTHHLIAGGRWNNLRIEPPLDEVFYGGDAPDGRAYVLLRAKSRRDGIGPLTEVASQTAGAGGFDFDGRPVFWLGATDGEEAYGLLSAYFDEASIPDVQDELVDVIAMLDTPGVVPFLRDLIGGDRAERLRAEAVEGLEWHADPSVIEHLRAIALNDRSDRVRTEAVETLGDMRTAPAFTAILAIMDASSSESVLRQATEQLQNYPSAETVDRLVELLGHRYRRVQLEAVDVLAELDRADAREALQEAMRDHPVDRVRREATEKVFEQDPDMALDVLRDAEIDLDDGDMREIRREALEEVIDSSPSEEAFSAIVDLIWNDAGGAIRREAVESLPKFGRRAGDPLARVAFDHPDRELQRQAAESLGDLPREVSLPILDRILSEHPSPVVARQAAETLGGVGGREAVDRLSELARNHPMQRVRHEALEQLSRDDGSG